MIVEVSGYIFLLYRYATFGDFDFFECLVIQLIDCNKWFIALYYCSYQRGPNFPPLRRVEEVFDCWFESGSMPYAQVYHTRFIRESLSISIS